MHFDILTIFPNILDSYVNESIIKRARDRGFVTIAFHNIRDYATDKRRSVDDTPYGGGPGMILKIEPVYKCLVDVIRNHYFGDRARLKIILLSPQGSQLTQEKAEEFIKYERIILICGRYEGVDARVKNFIDEEISIGQYVLSGGELPAMVLVEAVTRLVPGVLGSADSLTIESYASDSKKNDTHQVSRHVVEHPQYTRPEIFESTHGVSWRVPEVLLSGDHKKIDEWRRGEMRERY